MADEPALLPLRMANEYVYCPRLFWLEYVDRSFADSHDTVDGQRTHRNVDRQGEAAMPLPDDDISLTVRSVSLSSELLGITGTIDLVDYENGQVSPVDYKRGKAPSVPAGAYDPERVQLCLQGLLLREAGYVCERGYLYFAGSHKRVPIEFDDDLATLALNAVRRARAATDEPIPPPLLDSPKCPRCSLVGICLPDETAVLQERRPAETIRPLIVPLAEAAPLYVVTPGAFVGKHDEVIEIKRDGAVIDEVRLIDISHLSVFGNVQVSTQALRALLDRKIPTFYFSFGAWLSGMTVPPTNHSIDARIAQYRVASEDGACLPIARAIVEGKIRNQRTMVRRALKDEAKRELGYLAFLLNQAKRVSNAG
jgi:CRISP-associated protein Cas1